MKDHPCYVPSQRVVEARRKARQTDKTGQQVAATGENLKAPAKLSSVMTTTTSRNCEAQALQMRTFDGAHQ